MKQFEHSLRSSFLTLNQYVMFLSLVDMLMIKVKEQCCLVLVHVIANYSPIVESKLQPLIHLTYCYLLDLTRHLTMNLKLFSTSQQK